MRQGDKLVKYVKKGVATVVDTVAGQDAQYNPKHGQTFSILGESAGVVLTAPSEYEPDTGKFNTGAAADRLIYVSLKAIINLVNTYMLSDIGYTIAIDSNYSKMSPSMAGGKIFSADPTRMLFPHSGKVAVNTYHSDPENAGNTESQEISAIWDPFGLGLRDSVTANDFSGTFNISDGTPANIMLSRDFLREIQKSFSDRAKDEAPTEEKEDQATGGISVRDLFNKIFAGIRENSGGAWDFYLDQDDEKVDSGRTTIYVVNRRLPSDTEPTACNVTPNGDRVGIRELKLDGKVPKAFQAKFGGGAPSTSTNEEHRKKK